MSRKPNGPPMLGPYEVELKIHLTNGSEDAVATVAMGFGHPPTRDDIAETLKTVASRPELKFGKFRLMNRTEFFNKMLQDRSGVSDGQIYADPGGEEWDE